MDFCPGGSLQALLRNAIQRQQQLDDDLVWHIMADISSGLEFLHRSSVAHLDIKPDNVYR
jgi:mitosis inhibitor protein kinase SWE1